MGTLDYLINEVKFSKETVNERMIWGKRREEQEQRGHRHDCLRKWVKISPNTPSVMTSEQHEQTHAVKTRCHVFPSFSPLFSKLIHLHRQRLFAHTQEWVSVCLLRTVRSYTLPQNAADRSSCGRTTESPQDSALHPYHIWCFMSIAVSQPKSQARCVHPVDLGLGFPK